MKAITAMRILTRKEALNERHLYRQASMTKLVTYTILMMLYERGKFLMHQPISDFFPEWKNKMKFVRNPDGSVDTVPLQNADNGKRCCYHVLRNAVLFRTCA